MLSSHTVRQSQDAVNPVPGTVHLIDLAGTMHAQHAKSARLRDIVLIPAPSSDPDDPLNWSFSRKRLATACMCIYTLVVVVATAAIYSALVPISQATELSLGNLNAGTGYMFLALGWACLFWQPLAMQFGKRPAYLISLLATMAVLLWAPYTKSNGEWIANKVLQGFFGAPLESLCEISVADVYFQHERGTYIALYGLTLAGGSFFAPVIGGFILDGQGWRWVLYWCAIFCGVAFVFLFFFMEETNYSRPAILSQTMEPSDIDPPPDTPLDEGEKEPVDGSKEILKTSPPPPRVETKTKTYLDKIKLWQTSGLHKPNRLLGMATRPLIFLSFPVIFFAGFTYGSNLVWFNVLNATASLVLSGPPYNFAASMVGLSYVSPIIGTAIGSFYTGYFGDKLVLSMTRKNGGLSEAEFRLWLFTPCLLLLPFGLVLWGVGAAHGIHWFGCVFAMGVLATANTIGLQLAISYCIDSYKDLASEAIVTVILVRSTMSFAIGYGVTPWVTKMGLQNAFILAAFVGMAQVATFLMYVKYGKALRRQSGATYRKYVEKMTEDGMVH